jgi:hypothetical protein
MKLTPYITMKTSGNNDRREKKASEAARLPQPCHRKDLVRSDKSRQKEISMGMTRVA